MRLTEPPTIATPNTYDKKAWESTVRRIRLSRIGHLVAHADRECDVGEVAVRGSLRSVRVSEGDARIPRSSGLVGVAQSEDRIDDRPRQQDSEHGDADEQHLSGPLCRPARMSAKPTPRRLATLAPSNNTVAEPRVSSSRLASCTTCPLSARTMIDQTLTRKASAAESQPATTANHRGTNHISTNATISPIEPTWALGPDTDLDRLRSRFTVAA
jgi:hypothetical protein